MKLKSKQGRFELSVVGENEDTAYLKLPAHPKKKSVPGISVRQVRVSDVLNLGHSVDIFIDFDKDGTPIGLEFLIEDEES